MDITEKMKMCFNDELMGNKILTENEKKVLASLMYSYQICKEAKDNIIIRSMDALRKDIQINKNDMYDAIRNLESLYHMIERTAGESRGKEKSSIASKFKLNFDAIFNPPKERRKFDFSKFMKSSETSINTIDIDTDIGTDTDINKDKETNTDIIIDNDTNIDVVTDKNTKFDIIVDNVKETALVPDNIKETTLVLDNITKEDDGIISGKEVVFENEINNVEINYDIYKDRNTWRNSLPEEMNQSYYEKELLIFKLSQLHDIESIEKIIEETETKFRKSKDKKFKEKFLHFLNVKSKELGFKFTTIL